MQISPELQIQGFYKLQIGNAETGEIRETLEFSNLITNIGLDQIGTARPCNIAMLVVAIQHLRLPTLN